MPIRFTPSDGPQRDLRLDIDFTFGCAGCALALLALLAAGYFFRAHFGGVEIPLLWPLAIAVVLAGIFLARRLSRGAEGPETTGSFLCPECLLLGPEHVVCSGCGGPLADWMVLAAKEGEENRCPHCGEYLDGRDPEAARRVRSCSWCGGRFPIGQAGPRPAQVVGVASAADLESLARAADVPVAQVRALRYAVTEAAPYRTYLVECAGSPAEPILAELDALWLDDAAANPLAVGSLLDRILARLPRRAARRIAVYVAAPFPVASLRNLLESRFAQVRYGISAQEMLQTVGVSAAETPGARLAPPREEQRP